MLSVHRELLPMTAADQDHAEFDRLYNGLLFSLMSWEQLSDFWQRLDTSAGWYLYAIGEALPEGISNAEATSRFLREIDALLHQDHHEDYCGIVYTDDLESPSLVKIYDPNNLGSSCGGTGKHAIPPGWIMSRVPPREISPGGVIAGNRRRWWQAFLAG
jgi:hypothetical protein